ncbi:CC domain-containing protein [Caenorhabditis elegans]|uniref:CC domain-containing protein n=1 Tax=Caenorhabditis elegans TaxID=6239 RepID=A0A1T5HV17_CAEEL|nr:CC domain-containing protein [Caenorhabditis elegans]SKC30522.1 CC domain-containing protein [Caenorhabditis elegans]|eukprot:NP_001337314.1 Uncharacterized protein CELE_F22F4.9 [Caenorhabditis elegans]
MYKMFLTFLLSVSFFVSSVESQSFTCNPSCVSPAMCDFNTGICRTFRTGFNGPVTIGCSSACPSGTMCDTNTGICRTFRIP